MTPPAKKTTPAKSPSLKDFLGKDNEEEKEVRSEEEIKNDNVDENDDSRDDENNSSEDDKKEDTNENDEKEVVVATPEKGVDHQVEKNKNDNDKFVNPDGVTHSGRVNSIDKTPADISAETPAETAKRYGISDEIPDDVHNNPNSTFTQDNTAYQIPGGTHIHPDVARDNYNRMVGGRPSESSTVAVTSSQMVFASPAEVDDKGINNPVPENLAE